MGDSLPDRRRVAKRFRTGSEVNACDVPINPQPLRSSRAPVGVAVRFRLNQCAYPLPSAAAHLPDIDLDAD
jgi:hypothetical protein